MCERARRVLRERNKPLPHSAAPLLGTQELTKLTNSNIRALVFKPEVKSFGHSRDLSSLSVCQCGKWCFQHRVGGMQLEESNMTCQGT